MSEGLVVFSLVVAVLIGVGAAVFLVMRSPAFWLDFGQQLAARLGPEIVKVLTKRLTPEEEAEWRKAERAGRGEEWRRKRLGLPPKG